MDYSKYKTDEERLSVARQAPWYIVFDWIDQASSEQARQKLHNIAVSGYLDDEEEY